MELSIIILNYKTRGLVRQALKGIYAHPPSVSFEVIVVDNGSNDGTGPMVQTEFPQARFIGLPDNIGYPRGTMVGIREASGKYILLLNSDVVILDDGLSQLYRYLEAHSAVGAAGPLLKNPDGSVQESAYGFHRLLTPVYQRTWLGRTRWGKAELARYHGRDRTGTRPVGWLMSSCLLVRRAALDAIGGFDERFFVYFSDTDLCRRLWLANWPVHYVTDISLIHYHRRQSKDDLRVLAIHIRDWLRYLWKYRRTSPPTIG